MKGKVRVVDCSSHGDTIWEGDIVCADCGRAFVLAEDEEPVPDICPCGVRLLPKHNGEKFSARAVCRFCARPKVSS